MIRVARVLVLLLAGLVASGCEAEPEQSATAEQGHEAVIAQIEKAFPGARVTDIEPAPVPGLLEVRINDREVAFASPDGQFLLIGELFEFRDGRPVSLEQERLAVIRRETFVELDAADMVTFAADNEKAELYVFTDVSCGYCRRMHQQMDSYNALGITVHYLAFPRGGMAAASADMMVDVWCASDRQEAMTEAKARGELSESPKQCDNPVADQYRLGVKLGVSGTPAVYTPTGEQLGGYLSPGDMAMRLGLGKE